jgi:hypothetical protein
MNRRQAIKAKCLDCSGYERKEAYNCHHVDCSLHPFRTGYEKQDPKVRDEAIKKYCLWCMYDQPGEISLCTSPECALFKYRGYLRTERHLGAIPEAISDEMIKILI